MLNNSTSSDLRKMDKKLLIILEDFEGWGDSPESWSDVSFTSESDQFILKMTIVGDLKWKSSVELFNNERFA